MPAELKARLVDVAAKSGRTFNAEVVHRLEQSFAVDMREAHDSLKDFMEEHARLVKTISGWELELKNLRDGDETAFAWIRRTRGEITNETLEREVVELIDAFVEQRDALKAAISSLVDALSSRKSVAEISPHAYLSAQGDLRR